MYRQRSSPFGIVDANPAMHFCGVTELVLGSDSQRVIAESLLPESPRRF